MIDVGTGDGRAVLSAAARERQALVIGLDPVAAAMAEASRRAAGSARNGGLPNALFVVAAAESIPGVLHGAAGLVTVRFPWASLLRGCLGADGAVAWGVATLVAPGGGLELLLAPARLDRLEGLPSQPWAVIAAARATFEELGLACDEAREATPEDVRSSGSTWAKRLLGRNGASAAAADRQPVLVRFRSR
jgi:16S rRNA (adenine(1408)-N(1))-methyltransferase